MATPARAQQIPPDADWRTFDTEHFRVHFPAGIEATARRAAVRAERSHALLSDAFLAPPRGRIELVLIDNVDMSNGTATPTPRNRIVAFVHPPANEPQLAFHDDWLELLILHELVHIFHLENAGGVWPSLRRVFGRHPLLYPQALTPGWLLEGLATYLESAYTGAGRVRGSVFEMFLRTAALEGTFFGIGRATFDPIVWPAGTTRYVYGAHFVDHLAERYGADAVTEFVERVGSQTVPYRLDSAARRTFGSTLDALWRAWSDSVLAASEAAAADVRDRGLTDPETLTFEGRYASYPRYAPDGASIAYAAAPGREEASLAIVDSAGRRRSLAPISALGPPAWTPDGNAIVYAQLEFTTPYDVHSDLYLAVPEDGSVERLTRSARVWEPDVHPDGDRVAVVAKRDGTNVLATYRLSTGAVTELVEADPDVYWSAPRWSPDGKRLAAVRWRAGNLDVVILDPATGAVKHVTHDRAVDADPAWSPDGRYLLFSSDRSGISNVYAWDGETGSLFQVTRVVTGAFQPDVSPDGNLLVFSHYRSDGYHIARIPYDPDSWRAPDPIRPLAARVVRTRPADAGGPTRAYDAWSTIAPTYWTPVFPGTGDLGFGIGFAASGSDVVGRHDWGVTVLGYPGSGRVDGTLGYTYRGRGNPVFDLEVRQDWLVQRAPRVVEGVPEPALLRRDREADLAITWQRRRWRSLAWFGTGADVRKIELSWESEPPDGTGAPPRIPLELGARVEAGVSTVRAFGVSLGPQEGIEIWSRLEGRRRLDPIPSGADRHYWRARSRGFLYEGFDLYGFAPSVLAVRVDGGIESTRTAAGFTLGGGTADVDRAASNLLRGGTEFPVRGYPAGSQGGDRVVAGSAEFRFPIALVERGVRALPIAVDRLWGDVFADAGAAWCPGTCPAQGERVAASPTPLVSVGAEAILEVRLGYRADVPVRVGVAYPLRDVPREPQFYLRFDVSF